MKKILNYKNFKLVEATGVDLAPLQQKQQEIQTQISDLEKQLLDVNQQILTAQKTQLTQRAVNPSQPQVLPIATTPAQAQVTERFQTSSPDVDVLDYGFDDGKFFIGLTDNVSEDIEVPESEFLDFIKGWAMENLDTDEIKHYSAEDDSDYTGEDDWSGATGKTFSSKEFFESSDESTKTSIMKDYIKKTKIGNDSQRIIGRYNR